MINEAAFHEADLDIDLLVDPVHLHDPGAFWAEVEVKARREVGDTCSRHGFVESASLQLRSILSAEVDVVSLNGFARVRAAFSCRRCLPVEGEVYRCKATEVNSFGVKCSCEDDPLGRLNIVVPHAFVVDGSHVDTRTILSGNECLVQIVSTTFGRSDECVYATGRIVLSEPAGPATEPAPAAISAAEDVVECDLEDTDAEPGSDSDVDGGGGGEEDNENDIDEERDDEEEEGEEEEEEEEEEDAHQHEEDYDDNEDADSEMQDTES